MALALELLAGLVSSCRGVIIRVILHPVLASPGSSRPSPPPSGPWQHLLCSFSLEVCLQTFQIRMV